MLKGQYPFFRFLVLIVIILLPLTAAGQPQTWQFTPDEPATVEVSGYVEDQRQRDAEQLRWMGMIFLGILALLGLQMYKRCVKSEQFSQEDITTLRKQRQLMLTELARLDQQYALGNISESRYLRERRQRKQQLMELTILCQIP